MGQSEKTNMETYNTKEYLEDAGEDFKGFLSQRKWNDCRAIIADIEEKGFDASELRRDMNKAMAEGSVMDHFAGIQEATDELAAMIKGN